MTKKIKLILGITSLTSVLVIVPAAVISCGAVDNTTANTNTLNNNIKTLQALPSLSANVTTDITATNAVLLLPSGSTTLAPLTNYFDISLITNAATSNGVSATYSAATTGDTLSTLVITVTMTLGSVSASHVINVSGFPNSDKASNLEILNFVNSQLSALKLSALSTQSTATSADVYAGLTSTRAIT